MLRKLIYTSMAIIFFGCCAVAYELDMSVDEEIKKKYDSSKLNYEVLPNLPKIDNSTQKTQVQTTVPKTQPNFSNSTLNITPIDKSKAVKLRAGLKFPVKSNQLITDSIRIGSNVSFTTSAHVYTKTLTIPAGSKLNGVIVNSHNPQLAGNGGLVVVRINSITTGSKTYSADGKVTKANYKRIFFNNIKGKRKYWSNVGKQISKGENFYGKTKKVSNKMSNIPIIEYVSFVPKFVGALGYGVNAIASPVIGVFGKGGSVSIPAGSAFEIKLVEDLYLY